MTSRMKAILVIVAAVTEMTSDVLHGMPSFALTTEQLVRETLYAVGITKEEIDSVMDDPRSISEAIDRYNSRLAGIVKDNSPIPFTLTSKALCGCCNCTGRIPACDICKDRAHDNLNDASQWSN